MGEQFTRSVDPAIGGSALEPSPALDPIGQQAAPLPDPGPLVAMSRTPLQVTPTPPPPQPMQDPKQRLLATMATLFALGAGPRSGVGAGTLEGINTASNKLHDQAMGQWQYQANQIASQNKINEQQAAELDRQRMLDAGKSFDAFRKELTAVDKTGDPRVATEDQYRQLVGTYVGDLNAKGIRVTPQFFYQNFKFTPEEDQPKIQRALDRYFKDPLTAELLKTDPNRAAQGGVTYKSASGVEKTLTIPEAMKAVGKDLNVGADGTPLFSTAGKGSDAQQAIQRASAEFQAMNGRAPDPKKPADNDWIMNRAKQFTDNKDPAMESMARTLEALKIAALQNKPDKLIKVEHKDASGKSVIEWLPESQVKGQTFEKPTGQTVENRLASAQAVNQTGNDIITKLSDPAYAKTLGPVLGRYSSLRDFIGNPPPQFAELAGMIESYALANMGVHGMRSAQGAAQISKLLDGHHTPESIVAAIRGLNGFSGHFMQNEGRTLPTPGGAAPTDDALQSAADIIRKRANGRN